jgi:hypothetical protein
MTLSELKKAIDNLLEEGIEDDEPVCIEAEGACYEAHAITVIVYSDLWVPKSVVITVVPANGEADDG